MDALQILKLLVITATLTLIAFAVGLLFVQRTARRDQAWLLASFLGLYGLVKIHQILNATGAYRFVPHLSGVIFPIMMLMGPAVYLYARAMTSPFRAPPRRADLWLLSGLVVQLALDTPYFVLKASDKVALITGHGSPEQVQLARLRYYLLDFNYLAFSIVCLVAAFRLFLRHPQRLQSLFSNIEDRSLTWLRAVLFVLAAGWSWNVAAEIWLLQRGAPAWLALATDAIEMGWIATIAFLGVLQQPVFEPAASAERHPAMEVAKYARSALDDERMTRIATKLELTMTRDKLFEDPNLSLRALSDYIGVSENYVSQTLNDRLGRNFFDFVNSHRISEARRRLQAADASIVAVAFAVGFQSRSTFNAAFKKHAGATPSEHRAAVKAGPVGSAPTPEAIADTGARSTT